MEVVPLRGNGLTLIGKGMFLSIFFCEQTGKLKKMIFLHMKDHLLST